MCTEKLSGSTMLELHTARLHRQPFPLQVHWDPTCALASGQIILSAGSCTRADRPKVAFQQSN